MSNNAPITIIDAHRSVNTGNDTPTTGALVQSMDLLNSLLMEMMGVPPGSIPVPPLPTPAPVAPAPSITKPIGLTQTEAKANAATDAMGPPTNVVLGNPAKPDQALLLAQVTKTLIDQGQSY